MLQWTVRAVGQGEEPETAEVEKAAAEMVEVERVKVVAGMAKVMEVAERVVVEGAAGGLAGPEATVEAC